MVDTKQLDAVLAEWRDATTPLDGKRSVDPSFFLSTSATTTTTTSRRLGLQRRVVTTVQREEEQKRFSGEAALLETSCRPWSHEDFLRRVSSFSIGTWFAKPDAISVFACARHGWSNTTQPDQLYCPCCEQLLCFKIDPKLSEKGALQVADAFAKLLATGHSTLCPWRENPSPEAFTTLPIASPEQVRELLVKRIEQSLAAVAACSDSEGDDDEATKTSLFDLMRSLHIDASVSTKILSEAASSSSSGTCESSLKVLKMSLVTKFEDLIGAQTHGAAGSKESIADFLLNVALLSVCGWQLEDHDNKAEGKEATKAAVARCETCNRRWSLSSFASLASTSSINTTVQPSADAADGDNEPVERTAKRQKVTHAAVLDPIAQHRWFCPWVAARKQEASHERGVMSDELAKYGENDARLWEFMLLPGWRQYAQALRLVVLVSSPAHNNSSENANQPGGVTVQPAAAAPGRPEQALESVRAVFGLPDW